MKRGAVLIGLLAPLQNPRTTPRPMPRAGITAFAMELVPRITRAQAMDVLSSQANLAGYKAVLDAADEFGRAFPMMMTAAGTIKAARVLVMGAGVAGLQAIATARRLGAIVSATDVRAAAKEQVESLGATFLIGRRGGGADRPRPPAAMPARWARISSAASASMITEALKRIDIVICTALIPGRQAPVLLTARDGGAMAPGSVIVDLAVEAGGNVEGSVARRDRDDARTASGSSATLNVPSRIAGRCEPALCPQPVGVSGAASSTRKGRQDRHRRRDRQGDAADPRRRGRQPGADACRPRPRRRRRSTS